MVRSKRFINRLNDFFILSFLSLTAIICIAPMINTLAISFSDSAAVSAGAVYFLPVRFSIASYATMMRDQQFFASFGTSVVRVLLGGGLNFVITIITAYPLSKDKNVFYARNIFVWIIVFTMLFGGGLIPWYMVISKLKLIDSIWALVLPGAVPVFNVIILMNFFRGIPKELEEAAIMDGAGPWYMMIRVFVPVSLPALATITLFSCVSHWNSWFDGLILINTPQKLPLQTYIQTLVVEKLNLNLMNPAEIQRLKAISSKTMNSAKIVVATIPILAAYPFLQKFFIHGIVLGSVKE